MKIRLLQDLPIGPEHGMTAGRICEVIGAKRQPKLNGEPGGRLEMYYVMGDAGERCGVLLGEFEEADAKTLPGPEDSGEAR